MKKFLLPANWPWAFGFAVFFTSAIIVVSIAFIKEQLNQDYYSVFVKLVIFILLAFSAGYFIYLRKLRKSVKAEKL